MSAQHPEEWISDETAPIPATELVAYIRAGHVAAFERLYQLYWTRLYQFAFRYVQSAEEAEEIVQDVFFRVWRNRDTWHVVGSLDGYLYLAVRNTALDRLERAVVARKWRNHVVDDIRSAQSELPDASLLAADIDAAIERCLAELPPKRRAICLLRWTHDLSYAQIAEQLGVSEKTVETQIARGLKFLRERLKELRG
jgi:RNA polymerase sigma-70 factor (ECF subfamily)